jgi:hypothetical protein
LVGPVSEGLFVPGTIGDSIQASKITAEWDALADSGALEARFAERKCQARRASEARTIRPAKRMSKRARMATPY